VITVFPGNRLLRASDGSGNLRLTTALLCGIGYIIAISSVLAVAGGFLITVIVAVIYALALTSRDPSLGDRVGSIVADE
jgi:hypothetical protein